MNTLLGVLLAPAFVAWGSPVTWLEVAAFFAALAMVAANLRVNPVAWPLAIFSSLAYALLFANSQLYGQAGLQGVFIVVALWGWWQWLRGTTQSSLPGNKAGNKVASKTGSSGATSSSDQKLYVRFLPRRTAWIALAGTLLAWPLLGLWLDRQTDSALPYLDALATVGSITAQLLLARKYVENWAVWVVVNIFSVALFWHQQLWLTVLLYSLFALLALWGWQRWRVLALQGAPAAPAA